MFKAERVVGGDIGGTKSHFWVSRAGELGREPEQRFSYVSSDAESIPEMIAKCRKTSGAKICRCVLGIAAPIFQQDGHKHAKTTNVGLPETNTKQIAEALGVKTNSVDFVNDLVATSVGAVHLEGTPGKGNIRASICPEDFHVFNAGSTPNVIKWSVMAPGTGLGKADMYFYNDQVLISDSEGGHILFAPSPEEMPMFEFLQKVKEISISQEIMLQGASLKRIFDWVLVKIFEGYVDSGLWKKVQYSENPSAVITQAALEGEQVCLEAHKYYERILGAVAGDEAVRIKGGVIIAGGIISKIIERLKAADSPFKQAYFERDIEATSAIAERMPLFGLLNPDAAVKGATELAKPINDGRFVVISN